MSVLPIAAASENLLQFFIILFLATLDPFEKHHYTYFTDGE